MNIDTEITYSVIGGYYPAITGDHDSPAYGDPGDVGELEDFTIWLDDEDITDLIQKHKPKLFQKLVDKASNDE